MKLGDLYFNLGFFSKVPSYLWKPRGYQNKNKTTLQILYETNFLTEILKMRHLLLIMRKKNRNHPKSFLFW